jgi:type IV pilus assembly protein PilB
VIPHSDSRETNSSNAAQIEARHAFAINVLSVYFSFSLIAIRIDESCDLYKCRRDRIHEGCAFARHIKTKKSMTQEATQTLVAQSPDALRKLLDAHANSRSAYSRLLLNAEPPSRKGLKRARMLLSNAKSGTPSEVPASILATAQQTILAIHEIPLVGLSHFSVDEKVAALLSRPVAERLRLVPLMLWKESVVLAVAHWPDEDGMSILRFALQRHIVLVRASAHDIDEMINHLYRSEAEAEEIRALNELAQEQERLTGKGDAAAAFDSERLAERAPIVNLIDSVLQAAVRMRASDIHIRPGKDEFEVIYRIDGTLIPMRAQRIALLPAVVSRIKILSALDITERRVPQDGRIQLQVKEQLVDLRVSIIPVRHGESVVIRVLDKNAGLRSIDEIGFQKTDKDKLLDLIRRSYGIVLVTGPTGSGKTTTLYAALQAVRKENVNIVTVEDPIEYDLPTARQIQLLPQINFGFPQALRHILRHDPDVIMIGEMRDLETCKIAVESALTGHLVFSTLHTNDAASTLVRLLEIGIAPYMIRSAVIGVLAQRLVRKNCPYCRVPEEIDSITRLNLGLDTDEQFVKGSGCDHCHFTGFSGRMAIYELMVMTDPIRSRVTDGVASDEFRKIAIDEGMVTLPANGITQARMGHVSIAEVYRACM